MHATRYHVHAQLQVAPRRGPLTALRDEALNEGEDALFVTARCIGVADGVGSWAHEKGIDAGEFSRGARLARLLPRCPPSKNVCGHDEGLAGLMNNAHAISQEAISRRAPVRRFPRLPGNLTGLVA